MAFKFVSWSLLNMKRSQRQTWENLFSSKNFPITFESLKFHFQITKESCRLSKEEFIYCQQLSEQIYSSFVLLRGPRKSGNWDIAVTFESSRFTSFQLHSSHCSQAEKRWTKSIVFKCREIMFRFNSCRQCNFWLTSKLLRKDYYGVRSE